MRSIPLSAFSFPLSVFRFSFELRIFLIAPRTDMLPFMPAPLVRFIAAVIFFAAFHLFHAPELPAASEGDHYLLNGTSAVVVLNEVFAAEHTINYKLDPGYSFVFNGI